MVAFDAVGPSSAGAVSSTSPLSWTHPGGASATAVYVGASLGKLSDSGITLTATYGGVAMTALKTVHPNNGTDGFLTVFKLESPPTGSQTAVVSASSGSGFTLIGGSISVTGSGGSGTAFSNAGSGTAASASSGTSTSGGLVIAFTSSGTSVTSATSPLTSRFLKNNDTSSAAGNTAGATAPSTGSSVTTAWTISNDWWAVAGVEALPASGGTTHSGSFAITLPKPSTSLSGSTPTAFTPVGTEQWPDTSFGVGLTTVTAGDLLVCQMVGHSTTVWCTGLSSAGTTWTQIGSPVIGTTSGWSAVAFLGKVVTPGSNVTVTPAWNGTGPTFHNRIREFTVAGGNWSLDKLGSIDSAGTSSWASLTASGPHELYWGWTTNSGNAVAGSQPGWTYEVDLDGDGGAFNPNCGPGAVQATWGDSGQGFGLMMLVSAGSAHSGSFNLSLPKPAVSLAGKAVHSGSLVIPLPKPTASLTGTTAHSGSLAISLPKPAVSLAGKTVHSGSLSLLLPKPAVSLTGKVTHNGSLATALPVSRLNLNGQVVHKGAFSLTLPLPSVSLSASKGITGQFSLVLPKPVLNLSGKSAHSGQLSISLPKPALSLSGKSVHSGSLGIILPKPVLSLSGKSAHGGQFSTVLPKPVLTLNGSIADLPDPPSPGMLMALTG